jgi:hypothetical protein
VGISLGKVVEKAEKLLKNGRVEALGEGKYNVIGDHGTYIVVQNYDGTISCNCLGFLRRRKCSHSLPVLLFTKYSRKKTFNLSKE